MKSVSVLESGLFKVSAVCCLNFVFEHYSLEMYGILGIVQKTESSCQKRLENSGFSFTIAINGKTNHTMSYEAT